MKDNIRDSLNNLSEIDVYSLLLFILYKMGDIPEYSTLSELVFCLDKKSLLNLLSCFGGMTIRIPTKKELSLIINALLLYQEVQMEGKSFKDALEDIEYDDFSLEDLKVAYINVCEIIKKYNFRGK